MEIQTNEFVSIIRNITLASRYSNQVRAPKTYLLYGPSGTGKTQMCNMINTHLCRTMVSVSGNDIYDKWTGNSEKNAQKVSFKREQSLALLLDFLKAKISFKGPFPSSVSIKDNQGV